MTRRFLFASLAAVAVAFSFAGLAHAKPAVKAPAAASCCAPGAACCVPGAPCCQ